MVVAISEMRRTVPQGRFGWLHLYGQLVQPLSRGAVLGERAPLKLPAHAAVAEQLMHDIANTTSRTGALPAEEGYPAGLASALAAFA